ncbi:MAG: 30S ribosomal protein S8 [Verrucomicrobiales bacterium]
MSVVSDPIADFLTRLRNASMARKDTVRVPFSKMKREIAEILHKEGYVDDVSLDTSETHPVLIVKTRFVEKTPALTGLKRVSRPGLRRYVGSQEIPRVLGGMGIAILSTSKGLMTGREAKNNKLGGELLAYVW